MFREKIDILEEKVLEIEEKVKRLAKENYSNEIKLAVSTKVLEDVCETLGAIQKFLQELIKET